MNSASDYLNQLENFPERTSLMDRDNLCMLLEGYFDWRESKEWIKIEDGLPEKEQRVFAYDGYCLVTCFYTNNIWTNKKDAFLDEQDEQPGIFYPTHWRKLPTIPK